MLEVVAGPILFAVGAVCIYLAIHGPPAGMALRPRDSNVPKIRGLTGLSMPKTVLNRRQTGGRPIPPGDVLVVEMLTEMLHLREQVSELKSELESRRPRGKRTTKLAS